MIGSCGLGASTLRPLPPLPSPPYDRHRQRRPPHLNIQCIASIAVFHVTHSDAPCCTCLHSEAREIAHLFEEVEELLFVRVAIGVALQTSVSGARSSGGREIGLLATPQLHRPTHLGISDTATSTLSGRRYMICATSNVLRNSRGAFWSAAFWSPVELWSVLA